MTPAPGPHAITRDVTAPRDEPGPIANPAPEADLDPRLDTSAWRVFGRRFPRRWSLYFRILAAVFLVLCWVGGSPATSPTSATSSSQASTRPSPAYREPLRAIADDFAVLVNRLADEGYGWQSGGLPALRAADALSNSEQTQYVAVGNAGSETKGRRSSGERRGPEPCPLPIDARLVADVTPYTRRRFQGSRSAEGHHRLERTA